jgi:ferredoxin-type protein NapF
MSAVENPGPSRRALFRGQFLSRPVAIINDGCLAEACGDACAVSAIRFQPRIGLPPQAIVNETTCTGCGDCARACPGDAITLGAARRGDVS